MEIANQLGGLVGRTPLPVEPCATGRRVGADAVARLAETVEAEGDVVVISMSAFCGSAIIRTSPVGLLQ